MKLVPQLVNNDQNARLAFARGNDLIYKTDDGFLFPVPLQEAGAAALRVEEKALTLVRWIIRQLLAQKEGIATRNAP